MAGLYDGLEEAGFHPVAGGYLFQPAGPWFFGRRPCYLVNEDQKRAIAACIRETFRRVRLYVFSAAILMPIILIGGTLFLAMRDSRLRVTLTDANGAASAHFEMIGASGADGEVPGASGSKMVFHVSGPPGDDATISYALVNASGKAAPAATLPFKKDGVRFVMNGPDGKILNTAVVVGLRGATHDRILLYSLLLGLPIFSFYYASLALYFARRLRPLTADLPRSQQRIEARRSLRRIAAQASPKLLVLIGVCGVAPVLGTALYVWTTTDWSPLNMSLVGIVVAASAFATARMGYLLILRVRVRRDATLGVNG